MSRIVRLLPHNRIILVITIHHFSGPVFLVSAHMPVSECCPVISEAREGALTDCRISLCETHTFLSHPVQIGSLNILLAITAQITISHVITQNKDNVWFCVFLCRTAFAANAAEIKLDCKAASFLFSSFSYGIKVMNYLFVFI